MSERAPIIGINTLLEPDDRGGMTCLRPSYWEAVVRAGGVPLIVPQLEDRAALVAVLDRVDGFMMIGGDDLPGERFGEATLKTAIPLDPRREKTDFLLWERLLARRTPTLAICLACQELNVVFGGTLYQDLPYDGPPSEIRHYAKSSEQMLTHGLAIEAGSSLAALWDGAREATVNSGHHQAVKRLGGGLRALGHAPDGILEAFEVAGAPFVLAIQWHPERMADDPRQEKLFETLVGHALKSRRD